jgi:hypothetical protein
MGHMVLGAVEGKDYWGIMAPTVWGWRMMDGVDGEVDDEDDGGHNFFSGLFIFGPFLIHGVFFLIFFSGYNFYFYFILFFRVVHFWTFSDS